MSLYLVAFFIIFGLWLYTPRASRIPQLKPTGSSKWLPGYLSYLLNADELLNQAYRQYSKHGHTCQLPSTSFGSSTILSSKDLPWLASQPPDLLSFSEWSAEALQARWTLGHAHFVNGKTIAQLRRAVLRTSTSTLIPQFQDELGHSIGRVLGNDHDTAKTVNTLQAMRRVLLRSSARYTVGSPLCESGGLVEQC